MHTLQQFKLVFHAILISYIVLLIHLLFMPLLDWFLFIAHLQFNVLQMVLYF